jgi:short subunit dehydrogenase-like uncharacterized protein
VTDIVVYGATGLIGRHVCGELDAAGASFAIAGRDRAALERLSYSAADIHAATLDDAEGLARAFDGTRVVVNCAGPLAEVGEPLLVAALAAGANYIDLGGDQAFVHAMYERYDSTARHAGRVAVLGCAVNGALGDLAAGWAAGHVCGNHEDDTAPVRATPVPRLAEDRPLEDVAVSYVFDQLVLSPASQRAVFAGLNARGLAWRRDRWEHLAPGALRRRINAGSAMGGERDVVSFPGGDVITVPRHVAARAVQTFVSTTRGSIASAALRLVARAMPLVPRRAADLFATYSPPEEDYARTHFAVVAQARRGFSAAQVVVTGVDLYRASAVIAAWMARQIAARADGPTGMRAPTELFRPAATLRELASIGALAVEPSFG